jgi:uncharacterized protein with PIN domain
LDTRLAACARADYVAPVLATRFVTDASLEFVARRLRFLGYDVLTHPGARLDELFEAAAREGRTVLTLSERHPRRWAAIPCVRAERDDPAATLRAIVERHAPAGAPFSRCPRCNVSLRPRSAFEAHGEVPGRVTRSGSPLTWCPACGRWYWLGTHVTHLTRWLEDAIGRPLSALPAPGAPPLA